MRVLSILLLLASSALAGEYAVLASGMRLHVDRHELNGGKIVLYDGEGSTVLNAAQVRAFEAEDYVAPPPAPTPQLPVAAQAAAPANPHQLVDTAAKKNDIPARLLHSVVAAESGYQAGAVSPKGAVGLMQLMPATAKAYGVDPNDPAQNVEAGTAYLRDLLVKYNGEVPAALAAYNAGPAAVDKYHGVPPYPETRSYVGRVIRNWQKKSPTPDTAGQSSPPE